jgi:putative addiction module killer protein
MLRIHQTVEFSDWLSNLRDQKAKANIAVRIERLAGGNPGDARPVGGGVSELRVHFGPEYRVYFQQRGEIVLILLSGGDKSTQKKDIEHAKKLADKLKEVEL